MGPSTAPAKIIAVLGLLCLLVACSRLFKPQQPRIEDPGQGAPIPTVKTTLVKPTAWLILGCVVGIGASVALLAQGNKLGLASAAACAVTLALAITLSQHFTLIAWIGLGIILAVVGLVAWQAWQQRRAIKELVLTAEATKPALSQAEKERIFGTGDGRGLAGQLQHPATEKLVADERAKARTKAKP